MINNFKVPFVYKVAFTINSLQDAFKQGGLKQVYQYLKYSTNNAIFRYRFKHSTKYRENVLSNLKADNIMFLPLMGMFYGDEEFSLRNCVKYLNEEEKEKYKKQTLETVQTTIKNSEVADKESISRLLDMFGLDLLGVKVKDVMPKNTTRRRSKKAYALPYPPLNVK